MQGFGYGAVVPAYCALHLYTLSTSAEYGTSKIALSTMPSELQTSVVPLSLSIGYLVPAALMCVRGLEAYTHQAFVALWQPFPFWIALLQYVFSRLRTTAEEANPPRISDRVRASNDVRSLRIAYCFLAAIAASTHIVTATLVVTTWLFPSLVSTVAAEAFQPSKLFLPMAFYSKRQVNMVDGVLYFLQYDQYIGTFAAFLWAAVLHGRVSRHVTGIVRPQLSLISVLSICILGGLGSAIVAMIWDRDDMLYSAATVSTEPSVSETEDKGQFVTKIGVGK